MSAQLGRRPAECDPTRRRGCWAACHERDMHRWLRALPRPLPCRAKPQKKKDEEEVRHV